MFLQFYLFVFAFASQIMSLLSSSAISKRISITENSDTGKFTLNVKIRSSHAHSNALMLVNW